MYGYFLRIFRISFLGFKTPSSVITPVVLLSRIFSKAGLWILTFFGGLSQTSFGSRCSILVSFCIVDSVSNFQEFVQTYLGTELSSAASKKLSVPILLMTFPLFVIESQPIKNRSQSRSIWRPDESTMWVTLIPAFASFSAVIRPWNRGRVSVLYTSNFFPFFFASMSMRSTVLEWQWVKTFIPFFMSLAPFFEIFGRLSLKWARTVFTMFGSLS